MNSLPFALLLPLVTGLLVFLTRRIRFIGGALAVACGLVCLWLGAPIEPTASITFPIGFDLAWTPVTRLFVIALWGILILLGLLELAQPGRSFVMPATLAAIGLACAALVLRPLTYSFLTLQIAALLMVFPALQGPARRPWGSLGYLVVTILSGAGGIVGLWLAEFYTQNPEPDAARTAAMLFALVVALTLSLAPLHFWLPRLTDTAPYQVTAWVGMVGQIAVLGIFLQLLATYDWLLTVTPLFYVFILGGLLSMTLGGALALAASTPRYWFAYAIIYSLGLAAVGLGLFQAQGIEGAALALTGRILGILLATAGFRAVPQLSIVWDDLRGLAGDRLPAAIALACAGAVFAGIPPLAGFPAAWLVYRAAYAAAPQLALLMLPGTALLGLSVVRLLTILFQPPAPPDEPPRATERAIELPATPTSARDLPTATPSARPRPRITTTQIPRLLALYILALVMIALLLGVLPQLALAPIQSALATLRFLP